MNIYLDIDGVIITSNLQPAEHLGEFLKYILESHNVYWLTTHCKGDGSNAITYLKQFLPNELIELCEKIKPTNWQTLKTEAIDFSKDFLLLDDYLLEAEKEVLKNHEKLSSWIKIDYDKNYNQLLNLLLFKLRFIV